MDSAITGALNTMAKLHDYTRPGGYSDPDNILGPHGTVGRVSEAQARLQMVMWSLYPTQLILGEDVTQMSAEYVETVGNTELIAINQDSPLLSSARRIVGGDLAYPCDASAKSAATTAAADPRSSGNKKASSCTNVWARPLADGSVALAFLNTGKAAANVTCDAACFAAAALSGADRLLVRDLLAHVDIPSLGPPFALTAEVGGDGSAAAFRLTPTKAPRSVCDGHRCDTGACPCGCECGNATDPGVCYPPAAVAKQRGPQQQRQAQRDPEKRDEACAE